jgi:hypothetical protein
MFRRKSRSEPDEPDLADVEAEAGEPVPDIGPWDSESLPEDGVDRVDLGSLRVAPREGADLRLQVDENTGEVQSVMLAAEEGALELRAFAAPPPRRPVERGTAPRSRPTSPATVAPPRSARDAGAWSWSARCRWCSRTEARPCSLPASSA